MGAVAREGFVSHPRSSHRTCPLQTSGCPPRSAIVSYALAYAIQIVTNVGGMCGSGVDAEFEVSIPRGRDLVVQKLEASIFAAPSHTESLS